MKQYALAAALFAAALPALAGDDFGIWTSLATEKKLSKQFSVGAELDLRFNENVSRTSRVGLTLGGSYKPLNWLKLGAGYTYLNDGEPAEVDVKSNGINVENAYRRNKHRFYVEATGKVAFGRFTLSLRERYQFTHNRSDSLIQDKYRTVSTDATDYQYDGVYYLKRTSETEYKSAKNKQYLRSRLQLEYNVPGLPLTPYVSWELSNNLADHFKLEKRRWKIGAEYTLQKTHTFGLAYVYNNGADDDDSGNLHAIAVSYQFKF